MDEAMGLISLSLVHTTYIFILISGLLLGKFGSSSKQCLVQLVSIGNSSLRLRFYYWYLILMEQSNGVMVIVKGSFPLNKVTMIYLHLSITL